MKSFVVITAAIIAVSTAGTLSAQSLQGDPKIDPNVPPPTVQRVPVVLGEVMEVGSHSVQVRTTRGESMTFETDSRTMMPVRSIGGQRVKVEFHLMPNGGHHAGRVTVLEPGSYDWERYDRELAAYPQEQEDAGMRRASREDARATAASTNDRMASASGDRDGDRTANASRDSDGDVERNVLRSDADQASEPMAANQSASNGNERDELPRTASPRPLLLGLGIAALASGAAIGLARRRRA